MNLPRIAAAFFVIGLSVSGCATAPITPPSLEVVVLQTDAGLDATYNVAAKAYLAQVGTMSPDTKATIKPVVLALYKATTAADAAQRLGDANTVTAQVAAAGALYAQLKPLLHIN